MTRHCAQMQMFQNLYKQLWISACHKASVSQCVISRRPDTFDVRLGIMRGLYCIEPLGRIYIGAHGLEGK